MTEEEWFGYRDIQKLIHAIDPQVFDRKLRLFAVACCRRVQNCIRDADAQQLLQLVEQFADNLADVRLLHRVWSEVPYYPNAEGATKQAAAWDCASWQASAHCYTLAAVYAEAAAADAIDEPDSSEVRIRKFECRDRERAAQFALLRDIVGNPFRPVAFSPSWRTDTAVTLARQMYESREFSAMPILADALQDAGCDDDDILSHCRDTAQVHVRGCWVTDLVLGKS